MLQKNGLKKMDLDTFLYPEYIRKTLYSVMSCIDQNSQTIVVDFLVCSAWPCPHHTVSHEGDISSCMDYFDKFRKYIEVVRNKAEYPRHELNIHTISDVCEKPDSKWKGPVHLRMEAQVYQCKVDICSWLMGTYDQRLVFGSPSFHIQRKRNIVQNSGLWELLCGSNVLQQHWFGTGCNIGPLPDLPDDVFVGLRRDALRQFHKYLFESMPYIVDVPYIRWYQSQQAIWCK